MPVLRLTSTRAKRSSQPSSARLVVAAEVEQAWRSVPARRRIWWTDGIVNVVGDHDDHPFKVGQNSELPSRDPAKILGWPAEIVREGCRDSAPRTGIPPVCVEILPAEPPSIAPAMTAARIPVGGHSVATGRDSVARHGGRLKIEGSESGSKLYSASCFVPACLWSVQTVG